MKIGILSMQKIHNYGSFLQALSLKTQFEERGHDVYFIDIKPGRQIVEQTKGESGGILKKFDRYFFKRIENYLMSRKMDEIHVNSYVKYLETEKKLAEGEEFDLAVIGSDEVFNATTPSPWGFSSQLFGDIDNAKKIVTYAASCGTTTSEKAKKYGIADEIKENLKKVENISVRDENSYVFVKNITEEAPELHVDPVFLGNYDKYIPTVTRKKPYLLVYAYANRITDEREINAIKKYAKEKNLEILCVGMQQRWCKNNITASAFELLGYVKGAECVVSDTFHGTVFSIKYNKKMAVLIRESNEQKLGGLLKQFELSNRAVKDVNSLGAILDADIDYNVVNDRIKAEQEKSFAYIDKVLGNK